MKKSCNNCKALTLDKCYLKFKITDIHPISSMPQFYYYKPLEECPKPKTYDKFIYLHELMLKGATKEELIALSKTK